MQSARPTNCDAHLAESLFQTRSCCCDKVNSNTHFSRKPAVRHRFLVLYDKILYAWDKGENQ
ncbi:MULTISPECIES: DUF6783 domain-containing protein [Clostridia]|uniref:DUF6783 domain-containing protein n=1 Tax=Clostridia TaxID=186801 RepID=UPI0034A19F16